MKFATIALAATAILSIGCRAKEETPPPAKPEAASKAPPVTRTPVTEEALGMPFYPGSVELGTSSRVMDTAADRTVISDRSTKDDPKKVADFFVGKLVGGKKGQMSEKGMLVSGSLKDGSIVNIEVIRSGPETTQIGMSVYRKKH